MQKVANYFKSGVGNCGPSAVVKVQVPSMLLLLGIMLVTVSLAMHHGTCISTIAEAPPASSVVTPHYRSNNNLANSVTASGKWLYLWGFIAMTCTGGCSGVCCGMGHLTCFLPTTLSAPRVNQCIGMPRNVVLAQSWKPHVEEIHQLVHTSFRAIFTFEDQ